MEEVARRFVELGAGWIDELQCLFAHIGHRFGRIEMPQPVFVGYYSGGLGNADLLRVRARATRKEACAE